MLVWVTSSLIPTVKWFFGLSFAISSNTPLIIAGVNSFDESPYLPPLIRGRDLNGAIPFSIASLTAFTTSRYMGSPLLPGSFVLSITTMVLTVSGKDFIRCSTEKGLYK